MEEENKEGELFYVNDQIYHPLNCGINLSVRVYYRWRKSTDDQWADGDIEFLHTYSPRPDYAAPVPKRKSSAAKQREELQANLYDEWQHLMKISLYSVRDYFRDGRDGADIPQQLRAKIDSYRGGLNNYSCDFWRERP